MMLADSVTLYIPSRFLSMMKGEVAEAIKDITSKIGGCTIDSSRGAYVMQNGEMVVEAMSKVTWWYEPSMEETVSKSIVAMVSMLVDCGEESVFVTFGFGDRLAGCATVKDGELTWL